MPAGRPIGSRHQEDVRRKIQASQLVNRLSDHALGKLELSATQIKAIEILLRKSIPDLTAIEHSGEVNMNTFAVPLTQPGEEAPTWERRTVQ